MKKTLFILFCVSIQFVALGQNMADSTKKSNNLAKDEVFNVVEDAPDFPGGDEGRMKFLKKNLIYPKAARNNSIEGVVYIEFIVEKDGSLTNIKVKRGIGGGCDEECIRVVKLMPNWKPGKQRGEYVRTQFLLPIKFILR
jgi:protein TonB